MKNFLENLVATILIGYVVLIIIGGVAGYLALTWSVN